MIETNGNVIHHDMKGRVSVKLLGRSGTLDSYNNLIPNSDFSEGQGEWDLNGGEISTERSYTGPQSLKISNWNDAPYYDLEIPDSVGHKIYIAAHITSEHRARMAVSDFGSSSDGLVEGNWVEVEETWERSGVIKEVSNEGVRIQFLGEWDDRDSFCDNVKVVDLEEHPDLIELTAEEINALFYEKFEKIKTVTATRVKSVGKNLFDKEAPIIENSRLNDGGTISAVTGFFITDFIKVKRNATYVRNDLTTSRYVLYDINKNYISYETTDFIETTANTHFIRLVVSNNVLETFQIEEGNTVTSYEPYKESIVEARMHPDDKLQSVEDIQDEFDITAGMITRRISREVSGIEQGTEIKFSDMDREGKYFAYNDSNETEIGNYGDELGIDDAKLIYVLKNPVISYRKPLYFEAYENGTFYIEPINGSDKYISPITIIKPYEKERDVEDVRLDDVWLDELGILVQNASELIGTPATRNNVQTIPGKHGDLNMGAWLNAKPFNLECVIFKEKSLTELQNTARQLSKLLLDQKGRPREIKLSTSFEKEKYYTVSYSGELPIRTIVTSGEFTLPLVAHDPYAYASPLYYDPDFVPDYDDQYEYDVDLYDYVNQVRSPFENIHQYVGVFNYSHYETPFNFVIEGYCVNPKITNQTSGESMTFNGLTVASDERLYFDSRSMTVWKIKIEDDIHEFLAPHEIMKDIQEWDKINVYDHAEGTFISLVSGGNSFLFESDNTPDAEITLDWEHRFF